MGVRIRRLCFARCAYGTSVLDYPGDALETYTSVSDDSRHIYINRLYFRDLFVGGVRLRVYLYVLYGMSSFDMYSPRCNQFIYLFLVLGMIFENFVGVKLSCAVGGCNTMVLCPPPTVALRTLRGCSVEDRPR